MALIYPQMLEEGKTRPAYSPNRDYININTAERLFSVAAGAFLIYTGIRGFVRHPLGGISKAVAGSALLIRGTSGHCPVYARTGRNSAKTEAINVKQYFTVNKPREEVYLFWRNFENLPLFMRHLQSVEKKEENLWQWKAKFNSKTPAITWNAHIVKEKEGYFIGWESVKGSVIDHAGKVEFNDAPDKQGTEVQVVLSYHPPITGVGSGIARLLNPVVADLIREDIRNFKQYMEAGEVPSIEGQPSGRKNV